MGAPGTRLAGACLASGRLKDRQQGRRDCWQARSPSTDLCESRTTADRAGSKRLRQVTTPTDDAADSTNRHSGAARPEMPSRE